MSICDDYRNKMKINDEMISNAADEELTTLLENVNEDIAIITIQLDKAKVDLKVTGLRADPEWFQKASAAKKIKGQLSQRIQNELSRRKKVRREKNRQQSEKEGVRSLLRAINLVLTPEQKKKVLDMWRQLRS
ncbi:hypothetical protein JW977_04700 [Candidatus Falkowbacteria bacterium]|nr:hypothetical protein [Candidatus Falkowbacteria bacterium]